MRYTNVFLLISLLGTIASGQVGKFERTGDMTMARSGHRATLLADGKVLITGGAGDETAELYDPSTGTFHLTGRMTAARDGHASTLLADGRVLLTAGRGLVSAEIYDPSTETFTATGAMLEDQFNHAATLLPDGKVLIVGGERTAPPYPTVAKPELYDPANGTFEFANPYMGAVWPTANALPDGKILIVAANPPEVYDPATGDFTFTGGMIEHGYQYEVEWHAATSLRDGSVLITGGNDDWTCGGFSNAEVYDPSSGRFRVVGPMTVARDIHTSTLLSDGTVLITGGGEGWCNSSTLDSAEIYDPATRSFATAGKMMQSRTMHTATLLNDGTVLITGGSAYWPASVARRAELYRPVISRTGRTRSVR
jgi:WD40 repeat protein